MSWNPLNWISWGTSNGVEVGSIDSLTAEQDQIKAREAELDARAKEKYGQTWSDQVEKHREEEYAATYQAQVGEAFVQGAAEGAATMQGAVKRTIPGPLDWILGALPWHVWVGLAVAAFWYLGGFVYLKGIIARKAGR